MYNPSARHQRDPGPASQFRCHCTSAALRGVPLRGRSSLHPLMHSVKTLFYVCRGQDHAGASDSSAGFADIFYVLAIRTIVGF